MSMSSICHSIAATVIAMALTGATADLPANAASPDAAVENSCASRMQVPGDVEAQYTRGIDHLIGRCVEKDPEQAVYWFKKAAEQGEPRAQYMLGNAFENGAGGLPQDYAAAAAWYQKAAEQGDAKAQFGLGLLQARGQGIPADDKQAVSWFRKAAEQGLTQYASNPGTDVPEWTRRRARREASLRLDQDGRRTR
jgi:TPR repeat protein